MCTWSDALLLLLYFPLFFFVFHAPAQNKVNIILYAYFYTVNAAWCSRTAAAAAFPVVEITPI